MNIILFRKDELKKDKTLSIKGDKARHIKKILKLKKGDTIKSGFLNGKMGTSTIISDDKNEIIVKPDFTMEPPIPPDLILIIALPRPKVARRVIYSATTLGIKEIILINSARVEKSYWQSPYIGDSEIERQTLLGLEQGVDTIAPKIRKRKLFKPFVQDELPEIIKNRKGYLLHPYTEENFPKNPENSSSVLIIGPEGGFIPYENEQLIQSGAKPFKMGKRIMRVETSVVASVSRFI